MRIGAWWAMDDDVDPIIVSEILNMVRVSPPLDRLPCGCECGVIADAFVIRPCSQDCKYYRFTITESRARGKPRFYAKDPREGR